MELNDILAGADTVMTAELVRLFKVAGCSPTACHACKKTIDAGHIFKLVSFNGTDEMCCHEHGLEELKRRDAAKTAPRGHFSKSKPKPEFIWDETRVNDKMRPNHGGYSRPSKTE